MSVIGFITDRALADELGVSLWFVQQQCRGQQWPHLKVAGRYRFTTAHVEQISQLLEVPVADSADTGETTPPAALVDASWGRSTRSSAQRTRALRARAERTTA